MRYFASNVAMLRKALKLIVHADDFGLTERINEGILLAHQHGIVTSASIMANGEAFEHAVALAHSTPTLDVGIHLTVIEEKPLLSSDEIPTLTALDGRFHRHALQFVKRYLLGRIDLQEIRKELEAQVRKVLATGLIPSHFDSHQHVHILPEILNVVLELSRKYHIPAIRFPREAAIFGKMRSLPLRGVSLTRMAQMLVLNVFCQIANEKVERRTEAFTGFLFGVKLDKLNLWKILRHLPKEGTCEIMCHPGLDETNSRYAHWRYGWSAELNALTNDAIAQFIRAEGIQLISYRELADQRTAKPMFLKS
jgi:hopanoid biosynthesis associated protein HpnK